MHTDEYHDWIEDLTTNEVDLSLTEKQIERFVNRAKELETETDFLEDDIIEELNVLVLPKYRGDEDWQYFVEELTKLILDEIAAENDEEVVSEVISDE